MIRVSGHFGEWLQGRLQETGDIALVTLCCPDLYVCIPPDGPATPPFLPDQTTARFARALGLTGAWSDATCTMPVGGGAGASTAFLLAQAHTQARHAPDALAAACIAAEGASDPLMYPHPDRLLWASRRGHIIDQLPPPPRAAILGGFWGTPVRTDPADTAFPDIDDLVPRWKQACARDDLVAAADLAAHSASRTTALRGPADPMPDLARELGALGHIRAHTGSARGLIFHPGQIPQRSKDALTAAGLTSIIQFETGGA